MTTHDMSGYYGGFEDNMKTEGKEMVATAEDVGILLRGLNDGSVFDEGKQEVFPYVTEYGRLVPGYQSLAKYY